MCNSRCGSFQGGQPRSQIIHACFLPGEAVMHLFLNLGDEPTNLLGRPEVVDFWGSSGPPKISDFRPTQTPCIKNPRVKDFGALLAQFLQSLRRFWGVLGGISGGFLWFVGVLFWPYSPTIGNTPKSPSGRPWAGRRADLGAIPVAVRPKSGPEGRFSARKHYCVT